MNVDFIIVVAAISASALVLHYKSHVKFVALGVFVGLALLQITPLEEYFTTAIPASLAKVAILAVPALILGINHSVDKQKKGNIIWKTIFVLVFTLFFLSSIAHVLPIDWQNAIMDRSIVGWQVLDNYVWFTFAAAILTLIDSIHHRNQVEKARKRKRASNKR
ncbi:MAG: hypothetical protein WDZ42_00540 [Candidatus Saccharimonadales bacterium]